MFARIAAVLVLAITTSTSAMLATADETDPALPTDRPRGGFTGIDLATGGSTLTDSPAILNPAEWSAVDRGAVATSDNVYAHTTPSSDFPYQRFDIAADRAKGVEAVEVRWEGSITAEREIVLSVWNLDDRSWDRLDSGMGNDDVDTTLVGTALLDRTLDDGVIHALVQARDPFLDTPDPSPNGRFKSPSTYDFSIAWMTDTQYLSAGKVAGKPLFGSAFRSITKWIVRNAKRRKIAYVAHTGDLINDWVSLDTHTTKYRARARKEFRFARATMHLLADAGMPFGVTPGNHDSRFGRTSKLYNRYFPPSYFDKAENTADAGQDDEPYYGGSWRPGDNQNHFDLIEAGGEQLIFLYLGFLAGEEEIDWANQVLRDHADRKAVLLTHEYLLPSDAPNGRGGELSEKKPTSQGPEIFEEVVLPNTNIFLTLSGHTHGVALNVKRDVGGPGRTVIEMLANYQAYEVHGQRRTGFLRLLQFDAEDSMMSVNTYSPALDNHNAREFDVEPGRHYARRADHFTVPVDLTSRTTSFSTDTVSATRATAPGEEPRGRRG